MAQSETRHNHNKRATTENPDRPDWPIQILRQKDTLHHRLTECGKRSLPLEWTRQHIKDPAKGTETHNSGMAPPPHFKLWPPKQHRDVLWTLANLVLYRMQRHRTLTLNDYL